MATPLPLLRLTRDEAYSYRRHPAFQSLLDQGAVLGYEVQIKSHLDGVATCPHIGIALPVGADGVRWLSTIDAILAEEQTTPGIVQAAFALLSDMWQAVCPKPFFDAWYKHNPDVDDGISYAQVFVARDGYIVGANDPECSLEHQLDDLESEMEACENAEERDEALADWDIGQLACVALACDPHPTAHQRLNEIEKVAQTFAAWKRAYPQWQDRGFNLCAPTA